MRRSAIVFAVVAALAAAPWAAHAVPGAQVAPPPAAAPVTLPLDLTQGGTGATSASAARTALGVPTGTSGAVVPLLNAANTFSGTATAFTGGPITIGGSALAAAQTINLQSAAGWARGVVWKSGTLSRWSLSATATAETGGGVGSPLLAFAYKDDGTSAGTLFQGERASGPVGGGKPYFSSVAAMLINQSRATIPNGVSGLQTSITDVQPSTTLAANPFATTSGSASVVISWPGHALNTGANVNISGAAAVGGLTPAGYYRISAVTTNTITITAATAATSTVAAGGGAAVVITPDFATAGARFDFTATAAGSGFHDGTVEYFQATPSHYITTASGLNGPAYQAKFAAGLSPSDASQVNNWALTGFELDVVNRGADEGYQANIFAAPRAVMAYLAVPEHLVQFAGNEGKNATAAYFASRSVHTNSTNYSPRWYQGFAVGPDALVSNAAAPNGHGGVGFDVVGASETMPPNAFTTAIGTSNVTVTIPASGTGSLTAGHNTPTSVYFPVAVTVSGVTISAGPHAISGVTTSSFVVAGTGSASASITGGGTTVPWISFLNDVPYAPLQITGEFAHGIIFNGHADDTAVLSSNGAIQATDTGDLGTGLHFVSTLAACGASSKGLRSFVIDANAATFNTAAAGSGTNNVPVFCDGAVWRIG